MLLTSQVFAYFKYAFMAVKELIVGFLILMMLIAYVLQNLANV